MRVIHVVPSISDEASGLTYAVDRLCESLIEAGEDLTLATLDCSPLPSMRGFMKAFPFGFGPRRVGRSPQMCQWLAGEAANGMVDVIHSHGMWQMSALYPSWAIKGRKTKYVVSPNGTLTPWAMANGSRFKKLFWPLLQRPALTQASCFHATAESEYADIRRLGFKQPVAVIPFGIDVPELMPKTERNGRSLLFLGRIHPKKGVDVLLHSWAGVMDRFPDWRLLIVGTDTSYITQSDYLEQMKVLAAQLNLKRVDFAGPLYGAAKWSAYREAELFVLPTHSENFGFTVAEALAAGTPAIVTKGAPWRGLESHQSGWWIDIGVEALVDCLEEAMAQSRNELVRRGINGREWMIREYGWPIVGKQMAQTYQWLINGGEQPSWLRLN